MQSLLKSFSNIKGTIFFGIIALVIIILFSVYVFSCINSVKVNNIVISTKDSTEDILSDYYRKNNPVFIDDSLNDYVKYDFELDIIANRNLLQRFLDGFRDTNYDVSYTYTVDFDALRNELSKRNESSINSADAYIVPNEGLYTIVPEVYGTSVNIDMLIQELNGITTGFKLEDYCSKPTVVSDSLKDLVDKANSYITWSCTYTSGDVIQSCIDYVTIENNEVLFNTDWLSECIKTISKSYNTVGIARDFTKTNGETVKITGGTWGSYINKDKELEFLIDAFSNCEILINREPIYSKNLEDFGDTYVEVDIINQHLWFYKDGQLCMETDVVTGTKGRHDTPKGAYFISERIDGKYLRGDGYKTWVDKWMRITDRGHGLHDAYWRNAFGGNIYTYSGSHGCINLPPSFAYDLFDLSYVNMPVIIY